MDCSARSLASTSSSNASQTQSRSPLRHRVQVRLRSGRVPCGRSSVIDACAHRSRGPSDRLFARCRSAAVGGGCRKRRRCGWRTSATLNVSAVQPGHVRGRVARTHVTRRQPPARPRLRRGGDMGREHVGRLGRRELIPSRSRRGPSVSDLAPQPLQSGRVRFGSQTPQARRFQGSIPRRTASSTRSRSETPRTAWL